MDIAMSYMANQLFLQQRADALRLEKEAMASKEAQLELDRKTAEQKMELQQKQADVQLQIDAKQRQQELTFKRQEVDMIKEATKAYESATAMKAVIAKVGGLNCVYAWACMVWLLSAFQVVNQLIFLFTFTGATQCR